jgi:murein DD-endopeptidase MepM/ murein hydrolase activator NlpD
MTRTSPACSFLAILLLTACLNKTQAPAPVTLYGAEAGAGSAGVHTVVGNETLWNVSQRYQLAMRDIAAANNLSEPFDLKPGQRLRLPPPRQYTARPGDSLYTVSRLFSVNTSDIAQLNNMRAPYKLKGGEVLRLPTLTRETVPSATQMAKAPLPSAVQPHPSSMPPIQKEVLPPPQPILTAPQPIEVAKAPPQPVKKTPVTAQVPKRASDKFMRPVEGKILSSYGPKKDGLHNDGINIAGAPGAPVRAAENGVVVYAGDELKASGNLVIIRHQDRWMTAYAHMDKLLIKRGDTVKRGQSIGTVGTTGSVDSPQLHFEVRRGTEALNPQLYLERKAGA